MIRSLEGSMSKAFDRLTRVMARLRSERGCPWDREQTRESLKPYLLEEAYEVIEAIEEKDPGAMKEELGDLLFQVVFHAQIARERGEFTMTDLLVALTDKMVRRHPHVFAGARVGSAREALARWEALKQGEGRTRSRESILDGVPRQLPALIRAGQLQSRAARVGFDWTEFGPVWKKVREELGEIEAAIRGRRRVSIESELGDLLFALVNAGRFLNVDPEEALRKANDRFTNRFRYMEKNAKRSGRRFSDLRLDEMDRLWEAAKKREKKKPKRTRRRG
jgi:tetrapyrrole methylase family protein/MazG family protein